MSELETDAAHVIRLIKRDFNFNGLLKIIAHEDAKEAITNVFNVLHPPVESLDRADHVLSSESCMVISFMQHLIVQILTKRLINLMTTEALILNKSKIPRFYLEHYLLNQAHFSFKEVISKYYKAVKTTLQYVLHAI